MNAFVYELMFDESDSARDRLIKATQYLLASYGYESTTTRMISNAAKTNLSAINFYFEKKENLVREAISEAMVKLSAFYKNLADEIRDFLANPEGGKEKAWEYIDRILYRQISRTLNGKVSYINVGLVAHENEFPMSCRDIMAKAVIKENEVVLADLIDYVSDYRDHFMAVLAARCVTAGIVAYMEKPLLNQELGRVTDVDLDDLERVEDAMHKYFMKSIQSVASVDPAVQEG